MARGARARENAPLHAVQRSAHHRAPLQVVPSDPATWDGTGSGAKALYGQYVRQRNALWDAHVLPVQCGGSGACVGLECLWARSIARSPPHNPHDP